jgi:hypothetical protein
MSIEERLTHFLKESANWEKKSTSISGIFLLKLPRLKTSAGQESIAIEINPINAVTGLPTKKRGLVIRSALELEEISRILANPKLVELAKKVDKVNPSKAKAGITDSDIIEI